jgi:pimeloyl-ACP methyl ester carboxylesterase
MRAMFVHGACVKDGEWWWRPTAELLTEQGVSSVAPGLPSCGEAGVPGGVFGPGFREDVDAVREVLQESSEPTIVVAHSYGGTVATEAAAGIDSVQRLVYIASFLPEPGQALADFGGGGEPAWYLAVDEQAGTVAVRDEALVETFLPDCDDRVQSEASEHLAAQSVRVMAEPVTAAAWKAVTTTYVVCAEDRGTPPALQRECARRADHVVELPVGHHPFLSRPEMVRAVVLGV